MKAKQLLEDVNHGKITHFEDLLDIRLPAEPKSIDHKKLERYVNDVDRAISNALKDVKHMNFDEKDEILDYLDTIETEFHWMDIDEVINDYMELHDEYHNLLSIIEEWKEWAKERLTDDEHKEWRVAQVKNQLIRANSKTKK